MCRESVIFRQLWVIGVGVALSAAGAAPSIAGNASERAQGQRASSPVQGETVQHLAPLPDASGSVRIKITLGDHPQTLVLQAHSVRSPLFRVLVADAAGIHEVAAPPSSTYRGVSLDDPSSEVVASIRNGRISGVIRTRGPNAESWIIEPLDSGAPTSALHSVRRADHQPDGAAWCATEVSTRPHIPSPYADRAITPLVAEVACDADVEFYALNASFIPNVVAEIENILNGASAIWELDFQVEFQITTVLVRTAEPDPYSTTNPYAFLVEVRSDWVANHRDINRDFVHLFTGKALSGAIGIAETAYACYGYSIVRPRYTTSWDLRYSLSAHEIGHLFNASHCALDFGNLDCRIMCASNGGCTGGIHSFGESEVAEIKPYIATRTCLSPGTLSIPKTSVPFSDSFQYPTLNASRWTAADGVYLDLGGHTTNGALHMGGFQTVRTRPLTIRTPATASFWTRDSNCEGGTNPNDWDMLKVEYFRSSDASWRLLELIRSDGITQTTYDLRSYTLPADAAGEYFSLRFTTWGARYDTVLSSDVWLVDDVAITGNMCVADVDDGSGAGLPDGGVTIDDLLYYLNIFEAGVIAADVDDGSGSGTPDGGVTIDDLLYYLFRFEAGC